MLLSKPPCCLVLASVTVMTGVSGTSQAWRDSAVGLTLPVRQHEVRCNLGQPL